MLMLGVRMVRAWWGACQSPCVAQVEKAKRVFGWAPQHTFTEDVPELVEAYKASGALDKEPDFSLDEKIMAAVGEKVPAMA